MNVSGLEKEKEVVNLLIISLGKQVPTPTKEIVEERAAMFAKMQGFDGDLANIVEEVLVAIDTRVGRGVSIVDTTTPHDNEWVLKREIAWTYSSAYENYLKREGWAPDAVQAISETSERILGHLQDPRNDGAWDRRGLVIGHVQSGKTANYLGVVARSADAGYKFIIVIAGIHNNLRKQTQERVDEGFIGRSSDPANLVAIGVGCFEPNYPHPATLTNIKEDFNKTTAEKSGLKLNDITKPIIIVIKKNVTTLKSLHKWLKELNSKDGQISDVPMLMIDDEADNASINTNKPDLDPTQTNSWLRKILSLFAKSCYVGYTATPFANIFINPESYGKDVREELFPRDFIYSLDAPNTYFGPEKVFLDDESSVRILRTIADCEEYIPFSHKKDFSLTELPPSLYAAFNAFIIAKAIRNCRGQQNKHCSMLVNISRFVPAQRTVKSLLAIYEKSLREAVKANYAMPESSSSKNKYMQALRTIYDREFSDCEVDWSTVKSKLYSAFDTLKLLVINSQSDDILDYGRYEKDDHGLTAIAVGGFSLSRGLTLEGLCVSYMYRNTRMYDTLMQMGRWFGYRRGYEDLCRVYLPEESIEWYEHIAEKTEELRRQIRIMRREGLTPKQFGLYVERHPDRLMITAANKMRNAITTTVQQSYSGHLRETYKLPTDITINAENEQLMQDYWKNALGKTIIPTSKGWEAKDVNTGVVEDFLSKFKVHPYLEEEKQRILEYLGVIADIHDKSDVLLISVSSNEEDASAYKLGFQTRSAKQSGDAWVLPKARVASRGDERIGLEKTQEKEARDLALEDHERDPKNSNKPSDVHYRKVRNKPLLMLHLLELSDGEQTAIAPAFGISFPFGDYGRTIRIAANKIWEENRQEAMAYMEDEEDFDE
ncbi:Z1 domain-containing protein [Desulfovibrio sp.]|uniref:Z1 domain-containing protein n=1 Tax=Desulfovibrio sp. TaxID=885 RepID=UPI0025C2097F|nr:Z1 domain-containing protein [Desulfovibrio sp.]